MQRRLFAVQRACLGSAGFYGTNAFSRRLFQRSVAVEMVAQAESSGDSGGGLLTPPTAATTSSSSDLPSSSGGGGPSKLQQLYKSSHKGNGSTPMPKPQKERRLRARKMANASTADPDSAPLFGARSSCAEDAGPVPQRALSPLQKRQLQFRNKAAFVLTPQALRRVKYLLSQYTSAHPSGEEVNSETKGKVPCGIRIGVRRRGCSGYSYTVNYYFERDAFPSSGAAVASPKKRAGFMEDVVVEQDGVKVVVDGDALFYVIGTEMDYVVRNVEEKFTFKNPNQKYSCGCEESFMPFDSDDMDDD